MAYGQQQDEEGNPYDYLPEGYQPGDEDPAAQTPQPKDTTGGVQDTGVAPPPKAAAAPAAFDRSKFQSDWLDTKASAPADMDAFLKNHPEYAQSVHREGKDIWNIADPRGNERVDALFDEEGPGAHSSWTDPGGGGAGGGGQFGNGVAPPGGAAGMPAGGGGAGQGVYGTGSGEMDAAMHTALMSMLTRNSSPVTGADVKDRFGPVDAIVQRNAQESRNAAAERATFQGRNAGGAGGSLDGEQNAISEKLSSDESGLMAGLIGDEMSARRQDVMNALQFAQGEERIALQKQLADMDHEIAQQNANTSAQSVGNQRDLGFASLDQSDAHFYDNMDNDNGMWEYMMNQNFNRDLTE